MSVQTFNRYENKYRVDERAYGAVCRAVSLRMEPDAYGAEGGYTILNIYYDTPNNDVIRASLDSPFYKEKLRIRSYGTPNASSDVYVEIKKKVDGIVNKRRVTMKLAEAYDFMEKGFMEKGFMEKGFMENGRVNGQVTREIEYILGRAELRPAVLLSYDRRAFSSGGLRVSFDSDIRTRRVDLRLERGSYGSKLLGDGERVMEIKSSGAIPLWLSSLLAEHKVYPVGFSKYGEEYRQSLSREVSKDNAESGILTA